MSKRPIASRPVKTELLADYVDDLLLCMGFGEEVTNDMRYEIAAEGLAGILVKIDKLLGTPPNSPFRE